ncbi:UDP-glucose dehydrogenase family protein [Lentzea flaviverrucosa]|uniref:UDP-glucose 6-dehydrogenase n=1 Tax=Lentzea flaviverrucosa TaxID=200379 RepID=A0A1H9GU75_9PSEU|nr:UDP-glucose/GDP-mannose dehydrogenase family protein [Lentzea flaviverrucosa]RDI34797.1 UDPglucose 6-dehydrogenase [Lentzea flaviverrucosa]SEQ53627.1 UDPglucose 6-dehydrogenase [Lentzea flaviverrucosa]
MHRIGVVGAGYVGLTTAACLAHLGHDVVCADVDEAKVERLRRNEVDLVEPGLAELLEQHDIEFTTVFPRDVDFLFVCVPTPSGEHGEADLTAVHDVVAQVPENTVLVLKSTVPVGTARGIAHQPAVSNPEFLREGHAVEDFLRPQRVVVGSADQDAARRVAALYGDVPVVLTDNTTAELVKYACNSFLAVKLSFVNTLAELCEHVGADIDGVTEGMRLDERIGAAFLRPGPGWGGSCLPKDTRALLSTASAQNVEFATVRAAVDTNDHQVRRIAQMIEGDRIGLLGLTFKAGTNDLRDSPALAIARLLDGEVSAYDPAIRHDVDGITVVGTPEELADGRDVLVVLTEWPEFAELDWPALADRMTTPVLVDTRGVVPAAKVREAGFRLLSVGHPDGRR